MPSPETGIPIGTHTGGTRDVDIDMEDLGELLPAAAAMTLSDDQEGNLAENTGDNPVIHIPGQDDRSDDEMADIEVGDILPAARAIGTSEGRDCGSQDRDSDVQIVEVRTSGPIAREGRVRGSLDSDSDIQVLEIHPSSSSSSNLRTIMYFLQFKTADLGIVLIVYSFFFDTCALILSLNLHL